MNAQVIASQTASPPVPPPRRRGPAAPVETPPVRLTGGIVEDGTYARLNMRKERLSDWQEHERNPRIHPPEGSPEWNQLEASLDNAYFDPIVGNEANGKLVSGHFRKKVLARKGVIFADMSIVNVAEDVHIAMMIAANEGAGKDDKIKKKALLVEMNDRNAALLSLTGVRKTELHRLLAVKEERATPTYEITAKVGEKHDYIMIFVDNETDLAFLRQLFEVKREKSYKNTAVGIGRAIPFRRAIASLVKNVNSLMSQARAIIDAE